MSETNRLSFTPASPRGKLEFGFKDLDFKIATPLKIRIEGECDRGNSMANFETTVKIPAFNAMVELGPGGTVTGVASLPDITIRPVLKTRVGAR